MMGAASPAAAQQGFAAVKAALDLLQKALPQLPMGSKLHTSVMKSISDVSKHLTEEGGGGGKDASSIIQELMQAARSAKLSPGGGMGAPPMGGPPAPPMGGPPMGAPPPGA
jgi:hypothetical protein